MMQKLVDGKLVDLTPEEIAARNAEVEASAARGIAEHIALYRRRKVDGGITYNGTDLKTDLESRVNILGAKELGTSIDWKSGSVFVNLSSLQMAGAARAVNEHIQKCFSAEKAVAAAHAATPFRSIAAVEAAFDAAYASA